MSRLQNNMLTMLRHLAFLLFVSFAGITFAAPTEETATDLVQKMRDALIHQNYEGTFVYMNGKDMETMHVVHEWTGEGERSHITALSGVAREIHRDDQYLTCIWPELKTVRKESINSREFLLPVPLDPKSIESYYQYQREGNERIAGRNCSLVYVKPLDDYRFGHQYCVDNETGLPLKVARMGVDGKMVEQMVFTEIKTPDSIDSASFEYQTRTEGFSVSHVPSPQKKASKIPFDFNGLPIGFKVNSSLYRPSTKAEPEFYQLIIGDGLVNVSLFISPEQKHQNPMSHILRSGAVHAMERMRDGYHLTAVGEVPGKTLSVILDSFVVPGK